MLYGTITLSRPFIELAYIDDETLNVIKVEKWDLVEEGYKFYCPHCGEVKPLMNVRGIFNTKSELLKNLVALCPYCDSKTEIVKDGQAVRDIDEPIFLVMFVKMGIKVKGVKLQDIEVIFE